MARAPLPIVLLVALAAPARAQTTINVPADYATIDGALEAASPGDTVLVDPGTYPELLDFRGKDVVVASTGGAAVTIVDGRRRGTVVTFQGEGPGAVLSGFTIRGGLGSYYEPGGILFFRSDARVVDCVITGCTGGPYGDMWLDTGGPGAIAFVGFNSAGSVYAPTIERCVIEGNLGGAGEDSSRGGAGAIKGGIDTAPLLVDCLIADNRGGSARGGLYAGGGPGAVMAGAAKITFMRCEIRGNRGGDGTLAIYREAGGGGIEGYGFDVEVTLIDCLVVGNVGGEVPGTAERGFGGIATRNAVLSGTVLAENVGGVGAGSLSGPVSAIVTNCTIVANRGAGFGGLLVQGAGDAPRITNTILWGNEDFGGAATELGASGKRPVVAHCVVRGGYGGVGNVDRDPRLVDVAGGDYHLSALSPCIEAGTLAADHLPAVDLDGDPRPIGPAIDVGVDEFDHTPARYCLSTPNSTGVAATMAADGVPSLFQNAFTLRAEGVPAQLGVFVYGTSATQVPLGNGFLCVGGSLLRSPGLVGSGGQLAWSPDLHAGPWSAGATWYVQAIFRDPAAGSAELDGSDGLSVTFVP